MTTNTSIPIGEKLAQSFLRTLPTQGSALQETLAALALAPGDKRTINKAYAAIKVAVVRQLSGSADYDTAQSIAQDVAAYILKAAGEGKPLTVALVRQATRTEAALAARSAGAQKRDASRFHEEPAISWDQPPEHVELLEKLAQLPRDIGQVLALRFLEDHTIRQVAAELGTSPATVVRLQQQGLQQMRELLVA